MSEASEAVRAWMERGEPTTALGAPIMCDEVEAIVSERDQLRARHDWADERRLRAEKDAVALRKSLKSEAESFRRSARCLRGEVERGVALRQSIESKTARADILEHAADAMERIAAEVPT